MGFGSNGYAKPYEEDTVFLQPASGAQQSELLLEVCARLVVKRVLPFHVFLSRLPLMQDTDVVILTGYENDLLHAQLDALRARGNTVSLVPIGKGEAAGKRFCGWASMHCT